MKGLCFISDEVNVKAEEAVAETCALELLNKPHMVGRLHKVIRDPEHVWAIIDHHYFCAIAVALHQSTTVQNKNFRNLTIFIYFFISVAVFFKVLVSNLSISALAFKLISLFGFGFLVNSSYPCSFS